MGWLSSGDTNLIEQSDVSYADGRIVCPRCEYEDPTISSFTGRRKLSCMNCGYTNLLADGVRIYEDTLPEGGE